MITPQMPDRNQDRLTEELSPRLREAVERVLDDAPSGELVRRSLDRVRRGRPTPAKHRLGLWFALAAAACIAGIVLLGQFRGDGGNRDIEIVKEPTPSLEVLPTESSTSQSVRSDSVSSMTN